jgi:hypothetical protein
MVALHRSPAPVQSLSMAVWVQARSALHASTVQARPSSQSASAAQPVPATQPIAGSHVVAPGAVHSSFNAMCRQRPPTPHESTVHATVSSQSAFEVHTVPAWQPRPGTQVSPSPQRASIGVNEHT